MEDGNNIEREEIMFNTREFLERFERVKIGFDIRSVRRGNDTFRRRIAILIRDEFLLAGGDVDQAFFLENNLYHNLGHCHLTCNPTPEEIRIGELSRKKGEKLKGFDPLKLVSENFGSAEKKPYPLTEAIIRALTEKEDEDGFSGDNPRGGAPKAFEHLQKDTRLFKKQKGTSLYRAD